MWKKEKKYSEYIKKGLFEKKGALLINLIRLNREQIKKKAF